MATYRGQDGSVSADVGSGLTAMGQVRSWSADVQQELLDASVMGDDWKEHRGGMASWTGSLEVLFDYGDPVQAGLVDRIVTASPLGNSLSARLLVDTTKHLTGNIIVTSSRIDDTLNDLVKLSITFQGDGPPTLAWT